MHSGLAAAAIPVEDVVDERAFAGAADAGDADEQAERNLDGDVLQIVVPRPDDDQICLSVRGRRCGGMTICLTPERYWPVRLSGLATTSA